MKKTNTCERNFKYTHFFLNATTAGSTPTLDKPDPTDPRTQSALTQRNC